MHSNKLHHAIFLVFQKFPKRYNVTENHDADYSETNNLPTKGDNKIDVKKEHYDSTNSEKEEISISGCRRRIQNRPNKKSSKSKSFCEQRKLRSHSPLPARKQKQNNNFPKSKVLFYRFQTCSLYGRLNGSDFPLTLRIIICNQFVFFSGS